MAKMSTNRLKLSPAKWVLILSAACVAWIPASVQLGQLAAEGQDPAGKGIYPGIATLFLVFIGGLTLGIPALHQARQLKQPARFCAILAAWLIILSPLLLAGWVILPELIGDFNRHHSP